MKRVPIRPFPLLGTLGKKTGEPSKQPHEYAKNGTAKLLTLFHPATRKVRVKGVTACPNAVLHEWVQQGLTQILALLPAPPELSPEDTHAQWQRWQEGLHIAPRSSDGMPPLRLVLVLDNLSGHHTPSFVMWLCEHGIMPLYTPLGGRLSQYERVHSAYHRATCLGRGAFNYSTTHHLLVGGDGGRLKC